MGSPQADARSAQVPKHASGRALPSTIATMTYPRAYRRPGLGPPSQSASVDAPSRLADQRRRSTSDRGASPAPIRFPPDNFKHSLTLFSKSFSSFPRGSGHNGALTLSGATFQGTWARSATEDASPDYNLDARGDRFSCWALPAPPDLRSRSGRSTSPAGRRALNRGRGARDWPRGLFSTTICRGAAPHQEPVSLNQPRARGSREANVRPLPVPWDGRDGGAPFGDTQAGVPSA
ncbi:hypothetical protein S83_032137 [Arachis hypogaea]